MFPAFSKLMTAGTSPFSMCLRSVCPASVVIVPAVQKKRVKGFPAVSYLFNFMSEFLRGFFFFFLFLFLFVYVAFFSRALRALLVYCHSVMSSVRLSVCPSVAGPLPPPCQKCDFWAAQLSFFGKSFSHLQKNVPTFTLLYISGCFMPSWVLKKNFTPNCFSPKIFLGETRRDTMLPSISSFQSLRLSSDSKILCDDFGMKQFILAETGDDVNAYQVLTPSSWGESVAFFVFWEAKTKRQRRDAWWKPPHECRVKRLEESGGGAGQPTQIKPCLWPQWKGPFERFLTNFFVWVLLV